MTLSYYVTACLVILAGVKLHAAPSDSFEPVDFVENVRRSDTRIVDGWQAEPGQFPWQVSLRIITALGQLTACGGSLVSHRWVLTAAHCTASNRFLIVRLGAANITTPALVIETSSWINHPQYNPQTLTNDVALVNLGRHVEYSELIQPIRLQTSLDANKEYAGKLVTASGYGLTDDIINGGASSEVLNWVGLNAISNAVCATVFGGIIVPSTICAVGRDNPRQSVCQGDSGGPLIFLDSDGEYTQVGVVSFVASLGCSQPFPSGYVRPGHFHQWFEQVTGENLDWEPEPTTDDPESVIIGDEESINMFDSELFLFVDKE